MAASANPSGGHSSNSNANTNIGCGGGGNEDTDGAAENNNGDGHSVTENSTVGPAQSGLRHNPGLSLDWTSKEQTILEDFLLKYASETIIIRYSKIAQALEDKTVRDVAFRCRWMNKKENGKRRKDDQSSSKKNKDKKENATDSLPRSSQVTNRSIGPPYVSSAMSLDCDDGISYKMIGGASGQLLEQNAHALDQISANIAAFKIHENINLFCQARNNIISVLNDCSDMPEIMKQMPPLPVKLNEELVKTILPPTSLPK